MVSFKLLKTSEISAKALVLSLMHASTTNQLEIGQLIKSGALLNIEPATIRVSVTRLLKDRLLISEQRGTYSLGPRSQALADQLGEWQNTIDKTKPWQGKWIAAHTAHLGRTDRKKLRACDRALNLHGYAQAYPGFYVRPDNLVNTLEQHQSELVQLGLDDQAVLTSISEAILPTGDNWKDRWSLSGLKNSYLDAIKGMSNSTKKLKTMNVTEAARETLLVGQSVIKTINLDPLLPTEIGNTDLFNTMVKDMVEYNQVGTQYWDEYLER